MRGMAQLLRSCLVAIIVSVSFLPMQAEDADSVVVENATPKFIYTVGGSAGINHLINIKIRGEKLVKRGWGGNYSLFMNSQANPLDTAISVYDRVFGFPTLEAGVQLLDYSHTRLHTGDTPYQSRVGYAWAAYIAFRRDVYRNRKWSFGYALENGLALCSRPYNPYTNLDNDFIGQHLSLFFGCGVHAAYRLAPSVELGLGFEYKHVSNSATDRPNKGSNSYGLTLRGRCDLNRPANDKGCTYRERLLLLQRFECPPFEPYLYFDIDASVGFRTLYEEWLLQREHMTDAERKKDGKLGLHTVWSTGFTPMVRYNQVHASGIGLEYSFAGYLGRVPEIEKQCGVTTNYRHSKHTLYIFGHHEVFYKQLSLPMSVGTYLFRQHGWVGANYEPKLVETIGIRYYPKFFKPFYIGYNVKANMGKAYAMELKVGVHAGHWNLGKKKR